MQLFERTREDVNGEMVGNQCSIIFVFIRWVDLAEVVTYSGSAFLKGETLELQKGQVM